MTKFWFILVALCLPAEHRLDTKPLKLQQKDVTAIAFHPDGRLAITQKGGAVLFLNNDRKEVDRVETGEQFINELAFNQDGSLMAVASTMPGTVDRGTQTGQVQIWQLPKVDKPRLLQKVSGSGGTVTFSPNGRELAMGIGPLNLDQYVEILDLVTQKERRVVLPGSGSTRGEGPGRIYALAWSPDGKTLAVGSQARKLYLVPDGKEAVVAKGETAGQGGLAWSPDSKTLVFLRERLVSKRFLAAPVVTARGTEVEQVLEQELSLSLWKINTGTERGIKAECHFPVFSPDGKWIAAGGVERQSTKDVGKVFVWDQSTRLPVHSLDPETLGPVNTVCFSPDGKTLAAIAGEEWSVRIWKLR